MQKIILNNSDINSQIAKICRDISNSGWRPDYVVGISRGGLVPAVMISHYFNVHMKPLSVSLRDGGQCVTDCGMSEDAIGFVNEERRDLIKARWDIHNRKNILIVDDINDTGNTLDWIKQDWQSTCFPNEDTWNTVWNHNVKFAVLYNNLSSNFENVDYHAVEINKLENDVWIIFPWEKWWEV